MKTSVCGLILLVLLLGCASAPPVAAPVTRWPSVDRLDVEVFCPASGPVAAVQFFSPLKKDQTEKLELRMLQNGKETDASQTTFSKNFAQDHLVTTKTADKEYRLNLRGCFGAPAKAVLRIQNEPQAETVISCVCRARAETMTN